MLVVSIECLKRLPVGKFVRMDSVLPQGGDKMVNVVVWKVIAESGLLHYSAFNSETGEYVGEVHSRT